MTLGQNEGGIRSLKGVGDMSLQLNVEIGCDQLVDLVEQLSETQKQDLIRRLLDQRGARPTLTTSEKIALLDALKIERAINETPSTRRADWYSDDGRPNRWM